MLRVVSVFAALAVLAGCATTPASLKNVSMGEIETAKRTIARNLRDPSSAQFRSARGYQIANGETAICIDVNARNGFGGMTGYQPALVIFGSGLPIAFLGGPAQMECNSLAGGMSSRA